MLVAPSCTDEWADEGRCSAGPHTNKGILYRNVKTGGSFGWQPWESGVQDPEKREKGKSQGSSLDFRRTDFSLFLLGTILWKALD